MADWTHLSNFAPFWNPVKTTVKRFKIEDKLTKAGWIQQGIRIASCKLESRWTGGIFAGAGNQTLNLEWGSWEQTWFSHTVLKRQQQQGLLEPEVKSKITRHEDSCCGNEQTSGLAAPPAWEPAPLPTQHDTEGLIPAEGKLGDARQS